MEIRILGAHNIVSSGAGFASYLIDGVLAVDAGNLSSGLSFEEQGKIKALLLSHPHYDHLRDVPAIGMSFRMMKKTLDVYAPGIVHEVLSAHLTNGSLYPDFTRASEKDPDAKPVMIKHLVEPGKKESIAGYEVLPVSVIHAVPAIGFQITSPDGKKVFVTSDTGPGLAEVWKQVTPHLLLIELTALNKEEEHARQAGHLTPALLHQELKSFKAIHDYLPKIVAMHTNPLQEKSLKAEVAAVERALKTRIVISREGMRIKI